MRAIVVLLGLVLAARVAHADTVVVLAGGGELDEALRVTLAGRGTAVASAPAPAGRLRLDRAAAAQRMAVQAGAEAAVWLDEAEVCAVTSDGHDFRHAPFPAEAASPRAFAAIATSLLDEMIAPPPAWAQGLAIDVHVNVTPAVAAAGGPPMMGPPGLLAVDGPPPSPGPGQARRGRTLVEVGPMLSPLTTGIEGGIAFPLSPSWRLAVMGAANVTIDGEYVIGVGGAELRHVGAGSHRHWDVGPMAGYAAADDGEGITFAGARIARTWEGESSAISLSLSPILFVPSNSATTSPSVWPGIWGALRWQFAL
jgi:hypothetical protein